jgi:hypothetical protein
MEMMAWRETKLSISSDPDTDWALGPAFLELDAETGGQCRCIVRDGGTDKIVDLDELDTMIKSGTRINDIAGPLPADAVPATRISAGKAGVATLTKDIRVIVGVLDDAIAFAHDRFRLTGNDGHPATRFLGVWHQDAVHGDAAPYGRQYTADAINRLMREASNDGQVDEDRLYRAAGITGMARPVRSGLSGSTTHGTHVCDLACGYDNVTDRKGAAQTAIIGVSFPRTITRDTSGKFLLRFVVDGLNYIIDTANAAMAAAKRRVPIVVNMSYGIIAGPHDGSSDIERAIDGIVAGFNKAHPDTPLAVTLPAGNAHLHRLRAKVPMRKDGEASVRLNVLPDDRTLSFAEFWLPQALTGTVSLSVSAPNGDAGSAALQSDSAIGSAMECTNTDGQIVARLTLCENDSGRRFFHFAILPTGGDDARAVRAPSGYWTFAFSQKGGGDQWVDGWVQRDDASFGFGRRGRQAYFDDPAYERYDETSGAPAEQDNDQSIVRRTGTVSDFATGTETMVIGGYRGADGSATLYTARGELDGNAMRIRCPGAMAVSDVSRIHGGVAAAGSRSGSVRFLNGTSVAAPQVARLLADAMAAGDIHATGQGKKKSPADWLRALARAGETQWPAPLDRDQAGDGRIDQDLTPARTPPRIERDVVGAPTLIS